MAIWTTPRTGQTGGSRSTVLISGYEDDYYREFTDSIHRVDVGRFLGWDEELYYEEAYTGFIRFDLSQFPFDSGSIISARMVLRSDNYSSGTDLLANVMKATGYWDISSGVETIKAVISSSVSLGNMYLSGSEGTINYFDVTQLVKDWISGMTQNYGVLFKNDPSLNLTHRYASVCSFANTTTSYQPYIEITYNSESQSYPAYVIEF